MNLGHKASAVMMQELAGVNAESGDVAFSAGAYDTAIELYSVAIDLDPTNDAIFANRCKAKLGKMLWNDALVDAEKVPHRPRF